MASLVFVPYQNRQSLLSFYKQNREKVKIQRNDQCYCLIDEQEHIVAAVKFSMLPDGSWLLRNMLVAQAHRGQHLGHRLLDLLMAEMNTLAMATSRAQSHLTSLYCFPWSELSEFYAAHGFASIKQQVRDESYPYSQEVVQRYQAYVRRGLDIDLCGWFQPLV